MFYWKLQSAFFYFGHLCPKSDEIILVHWRIQCSFMFSSRKLQWDTVFRHQAKYFSYIMSHIWNVNISQLCFFLYQCEREFWSVKKLVTRRFLLNNFKRNPSSQYFDALSSVSCNRSIRYHYTNPTGRALRQCQTDMQCNITSSS